MKACGKFPRASPRFQLAEVGEQPSDQLLGVVIGEMAVRVKLLGSIGDHRFRLVDDGHVEVDEAPAQVILRAGRAQRKKRQA